MRVLSNLALVTTIYYGFARGVIPAKPLFVLANSLRACCAPSCGNTNDRGDKGKHQGKATFVACFAAVCLGKGGAQMLRIIPSGQDGLNKPQIGRRGGMASLEALPHAHTP